MGPLENDHADAVIAALKGAGLTVGDGVAPKSADGKIVAPCAVVHPVAGGSVSGDLGSLATDASVRFRVISVGRVSAEARYYADQVYVALSTTPITVANRSLSRMERLSGVSTVTRDDDVSPPLFYVSVLYGMWTVPA